jgi:hypothetical protein
LIRFRMTYTNWPTVKSWEGLSANVKSLSTLMNAYRGNKIFLFVDRWDVCTIGFLTNYLRTRQWIRAIVIIECNRVRTGMRSGYFCLIRSASALRFSKKGVSELKSRWVVHAWLTKWVFVLKFWTHNGSRSRGIIKENISSKFNNYTYEKKLCQ